MNRVNNTLFAEFLGKDVKAPYRDGDKFKIARGRLVEVKNGFLKIKGNLGLIVINANNIGRISLAKMKKEVIRRVA